MDQKMVRVELSREQVDFLLKLLENNEPKEESEEGVLKYDSWYFSKLKLTKAKSRLE